MENQLAGGLPQKTCNVVVVDSPEKFIKQFGGEYLFKYDAGEWSSIGEVFWGEEEDDEGEYYEVLFFNPIDPYQDGTYRVEEGDIFWVVERPTLESEEEVL